MKKILFVALICLIVGACNNNQEAKILYNTTIEIKQDQGCAKAIEGYKEIINKYPSSPYAATAVKELALCEKEIQKQKDDEKMKLFSGYQNIKFGMNKEQVKELFSGKLTQSREKYLEYVKDKAEITFWFFNNALYEVEVKPNAKKQRIGHGPATEDMQNTINALALKYGEYEQIPNMVSVMGFFEQPLEYYKWSFKDKEIILSYWDLGGWLGDIRNNGAAEWETLTIRYRDLGIKQQKQQEDALQQLQQLHQAAQQKQQELQDVI